MIIIDCASGGLTMVDRYKKHRKPVIVITALCAIFGVMSWRYYHVNSFYFAYQRGEYRRAMGQIWASPGVSYIDLENAGVKEVDVENDMPGPKSFDFRLTKKGKIFDFSEGDNVATWLAVSNDNNNSEAPILIDIEYKSDREVVTQNEGASANQVKYYKKFSVQYMYGVEKKLYKYFDRHPGLRTLKMIPFYEYFQKK